MISVSCNVTDSPKRVRITTRSTARSVILEFVPDDSRAILFYCGRQMPHEGTFAGLQPADGDLFVYSDLDRSEVFPIHFDTDLFEEATAVETTVGETENNFLAKLPMHGLDKATVICMYRTFVEKGPLAEELKNADVNTKLGKFREKYPRYFS
jgi:hypothetical protein